MRRIAVAALGLVLVASACSGEADVPAPAGGEVRIEGFLFHPDELMISAGQTVTWENSDEILHTATSGAPAAQTGLFDGVMGEQGDRFSFPFAEEGTYEYFCTRHNHMRGTVVVTE